MLPHGRAESRADAPGGDPRRGTRALRRVDLRRSARAPRVAATHLRCQRRPRACVVRARGHAWLVLRQRTGALNQDAGALLDPRPATRGFINPTRRRDQRLTLAEVPPSAIVRCLPISSKHLRLLALHVSKSPREPLKERVPIAHHRQAFVGSCDSSKMYRNLVH